MSAPVRVALVTGAAGGIGGATVERLVSDGCSVVALDVRDEVRDLEADHVVPVVADVRDRDALAGAVALARDRFGRLDVAVAAAAVIRGGRPVWETEPEELAELLDVDTVGVWNTAAAAIPAMLAGPDPGGCRFVAVASAAAHQGMFGLAAYNVAKHGVVGLVKGLAADLVGTGVTAAAVSPGSTRTPMLDATAALYGLTDVEQLADHQLLRRLIEPEEIAATIAFCCSPEGAVLNGSVVHADGGFA
jgi:SDR family mycofactocin-dependent oxidoreductase